MDARSRLLSAGNSRLRNLDFQGSDLADVDLSRLAADELNLGEANLRNANLHDAHLTDCHFEGACFNDADWSRATLRLCCLDAAHGAGACFDGARLEDSTAEAANFSHASFRGAHLTETSFARAVLSEASLDDAEGDGVEFRGADLRRASLRNVRFLQPDFRGADLTGADLSGSSLKGADFRGALLDGARFASANCEGAWFDEGAGPRADGMPKTQAAVAAGAAIGGSFPMPGEKIATPATPLDPALAAAMEAVQDLIRKASADPRIAALGAQLEAQSLASTPMDPALMLEALRREMQKYGPGVSEALKPLEQILGALQSASGNEPPEEWKPWLEELMRNPPPAIADILSQLKEPKPRKKT